jgi:hypothetical protein
MRTQVLVEIVGPGEALAAKLAGIGFLHGMRAHVPLEVLHPLELAPAGKERTGVRLA